MKKRPPVGSVECWSSSVMLAPWWYRNVVTAETMPGRSGQVMSRRAVVSRLRVMVTRNGAQGARTPPSYRLRDAWRQLMMVWQEPSTHCRASQHTTPAPHAAPSAAQAGGGGGGGGGGL